MSISYQGDLIPRAKQLRKEATLQEKHLWYDFLKNYPVRFQRQKTIGPYIADFYCHKAKLVVELDGEQHFFEEGEQHDKKRTEYLNSYGLRVLRFANADVAKHFEGVCITIDRKVREALPDTPKVFD